MVDEDEFEEIDEHAEARSMLSEWGQKIDRHWSDWIKEKDACEDLVAGHQYTDKERRELTDGTKIPVTMNRVGPVIDAVVGSEIQGRQRTEYHPRELGDAVLNEALTEGAEWIRDMSDADGEESDAKRDCFITGLGAVETTLEHEEDPEGKVIYRRLETGSALPDPRARQANAIDARYLRYRDMMARDEFEEIYGKQTGVFDPMGGRTHTHNSNPVHAYSGSNSEGDRDSDLVTVDTWQWYEVETVVLAPSQDGERLVKYSREDFEALEEAFMEANQGKKLPSQTIKQRKYMTAVMSGSVFLEEPRPMVAGGGKPLQKFTIQFITGKRDKKKGCWYGLVRPMADPQKWANAFFSMLLHMMRTNATGGVMAEEGAIGDQRAFDETWADPTKVTKVADGALQDKRIAPKNQPAYPVGVDRLMQQSIQAIQDVTGVPSELLGLTDRDQPGVLEAQRKQAAYGLLATFFESFRRYRKFNGELLLVYLEMLGPETLIRVTGEDGIKQQYMPLVDALSQNAKYDVIVDEAPAGPNQKERTWAMFMSLPPALIMQLTPEMWAEVLKYSPFPESFSIKLREMIMGGDDEQKKAAVEAMQQQAFQAQQAKEAAAIRKTNAEAESKEVETMVTIMRPDPNPQIVS